MSRIEQDVTLGGRYRLQERIAAGGMGTVWEAEDTVLHRRVAVKLLSDALGSDPRFVERFRREARAAAGLSHPNIAGVFDYGEDDATPYLVMELLDGETLADRLASRGPLPADAAADIAANVAEALQAAHEAGVIHRDIKPGNVMLDRSDRVKVMDFGIAAASWAAPITASGTTLGTASYLSPEQAAGRKVTPASDLYSLGCVLFEMLTGRPPFTGDSPVAIASAHAHKAPPSLRELAPGTPQALASACEQALSKDPGARPASAAAFAEQLRSGPDASVSAPAASAAAAAATRELSAPAPTAVLPVTQSPAPKPVATQPGGQRRRRTLLWAWVAGAAALAGLAILIASLASSPTAREPSAPTPPAADSPSPTDTVPNVVGIPMTQAIARLNAAGITNVDVARAEEGQPGVVIDVQPNEGTAVSPGQSVTLFVGPLRGNEEGDGKGKKGGNGKGGGGGH